jgi:hypothetical protein
MTLIPSSSEPKSGRNSPESTRPLFSATATRIFRVGLGGAVLLVASSGILAAAYFHSNHWYGVGFAPKQPATFSHRLHAGELRIDCRNCHASVETSAFAGIPTTQTCLTCHSQISTETSSLRPVIWSSAQNVPLQWVRVTHVPDHVYFDHSIHVNKGVGCTTCHGNIGKMVLTAKSEPLTMRWCLDCHRDPGPHLRPLTEIFSAVSHPSQSRESQEELVRSYHIRLENLTNCSACHR